MTTASLSAEFQTPFERHYISESETSGRFWLALKENGEWTPMDDDTNTTQVVVAHFSTPLDIFFGDDEKSSIDWAYDLQDIKVKYTPTDEQIKQAFIPLEVDENGFADYELTANAKTEIKKAVESCIDANLMDMEEPFLEKMKAAL
ncbi:hypothetical protein [uncultured Psychrobacter sp.]|uniref:hypothetical protein n=1 Tax=uncultured Psychrobacter sp. TaxID=259303 RepID=UPI0030D78FD3